MIDKLRVCKSAKYKFTKGNFEKLLRWMALLGHRNHNIM